MKKIGIWGKPSDLSIIETLYAVCQFLIDKQYDVFVDAESKKYIENLPVQSQTAENLAQCCDVIIALGGDGTFLAAARSVVYNNVPLIGINLGRLGFLVDISPNDLPEKLYDILNGHYFAEERYLLQATIVRDNQIIHKELAVNEVAIHRWITPSMIEIMTKIDGVFLNTQHSDGLIISTPTGSTAYALSAGGPILSPWLQALVLVPLNPFTLSNRPIVVHDLAEIEISFCQQKQINALVTCDHTQIPDVLISDKILIRKVNTPIKILHPKEHDFFEILRNKLHWGGGYHH